MSNPAKTLSYVRHLELRGELERLPGEPSMIQSMRRT